MPIIKPENLSCVLFTGSNRKGASTDDIKQVIEMVRESRKHTHNSGLTVFAGGNTLIYIEGEKDLVNAEYQESKRHPLQQSSIKLYKGAVPHRFFEDFPLAVRVVSPESLRKFDDFDTPEKLEYFEAFLDLDEPVSKIVKDFINNNV